ncbi:iron-sulfur cluster assembly protein SufB [Klebsiella pneumoniae]|uniref:Iron-sulfur cluster assembly protein SufB n=1 Tax=Klebsiella pneumoniae TaxID=573 RepID=A0A2X3EK03_KLEPN|nr:iron-sulfur cluster assembly protein SufB [Klebsiella pneumoniae]
MRPAPPSLARCSRPGANTFLTSEVEEAFNQLGVPVREGREVAVDAIFDSGVGGDHLPRKAGRAGDHLLFFRRGDPRPSRKLVKKYLGTVVPGNDNFFAALNAAVASDGTFIYVPKGVRCPMELSDLFPHQRRKDRTV